jgi:DNA-binding CsgD family transcriptional regulator
VFSAQDVERLATLLSPLRAALTLAQQGFGQQIERETLGYRRAGEVVFQLDVEGRVLPSDQAAVEACGDPVSIRQNRIACATQSEQAETDCAIAKAISSKPPSVVVRLTRARDYSTTFLMITPVVGEGVEPLSPAAAIGVLIDPAVKADPNKLAVETLRVAAGLTKREAEIVGYISVGGSLSGVTSALCIGMGTARNYLKSAMHKCGVHTQVELAALVRRFG